MTVTSKEIKTLWGRAASRCSICRTQLTYDQKNNNATLTIGEQAHIVAEEQTGPRGNSVLSPEERNSYYNLILLCPTHHVIIDKDIDGFPVERLHMIKARHEFWVQHTLSQDEPQDQRLKPLTDLLFFVERIKPILFWLYKTVPAESAEDFFKALQSFWADRNIATEYIDGMLTYGVEVLLRPISAGGFRPDDGGYAQGKLHASSKILTRYFSNRGIVWDSMPRNFEPTLIISRMTRNFENLLQNQTLDEIENGIVRHVLFILRYYQSYARALKYMDVTESFVNHFFTLIKPTLDEIRFQIPDPLDEGELFDLRIMCEADLD